jgi:hypothetical protein
MSGLELRGEAKVTALKFSPASLSVVFRTWDGGVTEDPYFFLTKSFQINRISANTSCSVCLFSSLNSFRQSQSSLQ